jgi:protein SCO1/2
MKLRIYLLLFIAAICFVVAYTSFSEKNKKNQSLPILNPIDLKNELVDSSLQRKGYGHQIQSFEFLNQYGNTITNKDVENSVYVVEYFFTTCSTICPKMNTQMKVLQKKFKGDKNFKILSFTVQPEIDSVPILKQYAEEYGAENGQWHFLTGEKKKLYALARKSFFLLKPAEAQNLGDANSDFIHTNNFVLIDKNKRIRGYYDGTSAKEVEKLARDIRKLL